MKTARLPLLRPHSTCQRRGCCEEVEPAGRHVDPASCSSVIVKEVIVTSLET